MALVVVTCLLAAGCDFVDTTLLVRAVDAGAPGTGGTAEPGPDGSMCVVGPETCNGRDDDCDGVVDGPPATTACRVQRPGAVVSCDTRRGRCVPTGCLLGFAQCDGDPGNGCEPECECMVCPDEDAGEDAGD